MSGSNQLTPESITVALREVLCPGTKVDIVSIDLIGKVAVCDGDVAVEIHHTSEKKELIEEVRDLVADRVAEMGGVETVRVDINQPEEFRPKEAKAPNPWADRAPIKGVKHVIMVASAKGGVGKSSVAVNLALALKEQGRKVGILDADIYGPSIPTMLKPDEMPGVTDDKQLIPARSMGVDIMSIGFWLDATQPVIWRGPMVFSQLKQFVQEVRWQDLDFLIVDMPPGTGDAQLTIMQHVAVDGVVMVTTPQEVALADVRRGIQMFKTTKKAEIEVLGIIENMSRHVCPKCGEVTDVFGSGGGRKVAEEFDIPLLGEIPIDVAVREGGDSGKPAVTVADSPSREAFIRLAEQVIARVE